MKRLHASAGRFTAMRYGVAVGSVAWALLMRTVIDRPLHNQLPYVMFFVAVTVAAWFGGLGPALLSTALGFLAAEWFFVGSAYASWTPAHVVSATVYFLVTLPIVFLSHNLHKAREHAEARQEELGREIGERSRAEESLRSTQTELERRTADLEAAMQAQGREKHRFEEVLGHLPVCVALLTPDHHVAFANRMFRERFGESQDRRCFEIVFGLSVPCEFCESYRVLETGEPHKWECARPDGRVYQIFTFPYIEPDGSPLVLEVDVDITENKRVQARLSEQAALLQLAHDAILVTDLNGKISFWNRGAEEVYGWRSDQAVGGNVHELLRTRFPIPLDEIVALVQNQSQWEGTLTHVTRSGQTVVVASRWSLQRDREGKPGAILEINRDVTERERAKLALAQRTDELARSNAELQQFAYVASHDLQEPLRMVANFTQLLAERYSARLDQDAREFIGYAVEGATRMQTLIHDLLALSRVDTRGKALEVVRLDEPLGQAVANLQLAIRENGALVCHDELPAVMADSSQMVQLFQNLIGNAIKFRSEKLPSIHISAVRTGEEWTFSVRDNGIGFEPEFAGRVFTLFQRLHTRDEYAGNGIGLAICRKIVERHHGRIWPESKPGRGTTFFFTIPAAGVPAERPEQSVGAA